MASKTTRWKIFLRVSVSVGAIFFLITQANPEGLGRALLRVTPVTLVSVALLYYAGIALAAIRWKFLMIVYGASSLPDFTLLYRLSLVASFYNLYLPGGVGGDVIRGVTSRRAFGSSRAVEGLSVVFWDRIWGLIALFAILMGINAAYPFAGIDGIPVISGLAIALLSAAIALFASVRYCELPLPAFLVRWLASVPGPSRPSLFGIVFLASLGTQLSVAAIGHLLAVSISPGTLFTDSLVVIPLAMASTFIPISIGGAGVREAAIVVLYGMVGMASEAALAVSLALRMIQLMAALPGGWLDPSGRDPVDEAGKAE